MQTPLSSFQPQLHRWSSPAAQAQTSVKSFSAYADKISSGIHSQSSMSHSGSKLKSFETRVGPEVKAEKAPEVAICPECGSANCACLARVTLQTRLDEENAKGSRDSQEVPQIQPMPVLPQSFNQMSLAIGRNGASSRLFG